MIISYLFTAILAQDVSVIINVGDIFDDEKTSNMMMETSSQIELLKDFAEVGSDIFLEMEKRVTAMEAVVDKTAIETFAGLAVTRMEQFSKDSKNWTVNIESITFTGLNKDGKFPHKLLVSYTVRSNVFEGGKFFFYDVYSEGMTPSNDLVAPMLDGMQIIAGQKAEVRKTTLLSELSIDSNDASKKSRKRYKGHQELW